MKTFLVCVGWSSSSAVLADYLLRTDSGRVVLLAYLRHLGR